MAEIWFYHLTERKLEDTLPVLLEKCLERDMTVAVQSPDRARLEMLDERLWTYRPESFLPHGTDTADFPEHQPVLLTTSPENINAADIRILIDKAPAPDPTGYKRMIFLFDGYDQPQVDAARTEWKKLKGEGHSLTYWQQTSSGGWEKKATG